MLNRRAFILALTSVCLIPTVLKSKILEKLETLMTSEVFLQGKAMWARAHKADQYGNWSITLYPDAKSLDTINEMKKKGLKNVLKKDDDGYNMTFRRPQQKLMRGKVQAFRPPTVVDKDGMPLVETMIGNGSDVTIKLVTYSYMSPMKEKGYAARWESVKVDSLVPFLGKRDFDEKDLKLVKGLEEQPVQVQGW